MNTSLHKLLLFSVFFLLQFFYVKSIKLAVMIKRVASRSSSTQVRGPGVGAEVYRLYRLDQAPGTIPHSSFRSGCSRLKACTFSPNWLPVLCPGPVLTIWLTDILHTLLFSVFFLLFLLQFFYVKSIKLAVTIKRPGRSSSTQVRGSAPRCTD